MDTDADRDERYALYSHANYHIPARPTKKYLDSDRASVKFPCSLDCPRHYGDHDDLNRDRACGDFDRCAAISFTDRHPNDIGYRS